MAEFVEIGSGALTARIATLGAELHSLRDAEGRELMTDADPAYWTGHAPLLFPIVGRLNGDAYRLDGRSYPMKQHGFARRSVFEVLEQGPAHVRLRLTDDAGTREIYPFAFALDAEYRIEASRLAIAVTVTNRGERDMPASFGFHPAFAWPLPYGAPRSAHRITFDLPEPAALSVLVDGALTPPSRPSPLDGRVLRLADDLFEHDALIWESVASRGVRYDAEGGGPALEIGFPDTSMLGIWTKPGAKFVCIEPWHGLADPAGFTGEIWDKPGMIRFAPGESRSFEMRVTLTG